MNNFNHHINNIAKMQFTVLLIVRQAQIFVSTEPVTKKSQLARLLLFE